MGMVPGMGGGGGGGSSGDNARLKKFMYMMDSMTNKELDGVVDWNSQKGVGKNGSGIATGGGGCCC